MYSAHEYSLHEGHALGVSGYLRNAIQPLGSHEASSQLYEEVKVLDSI